MDDIDFMPICVEIQDAIGPQGIEHIQQLAKLS